MDRVLVVGNTHSSSDTLTRTKMMEMIRSFKERLDTIEPGSFTRPIIESHAMVKSVQFRFPKCKSKRIARKWANDSRNWKQAPMQHVYMTPMVIFAHPEVARRMRKELQG